MDTSRVRLMMNIGFKEKEAKVYAAALGLEKGTVQEIAKKAGIKRTTAYSILEALKKKKAVFQTKMKKRTYFVAEDPAEILEHAKEVMERFSDSIEAAPPRGLDSAGKPKILFLSGAEGFKKIWNSIFKSGIREYLIMTDPREMLSFVQKGYITERIIKEKIRRGIKSRQLIAFSEYAKEIIAKDAQENRVSKVLPHIYKIPFTAIVFGEKTALISPALEDVILIIESASFAKTQRSLFEMLWEFLPERKN